MMNWEAISAVAETVATLAVLATFVYLSIQLRNANRQREIESFRHNWDGINRICELLSESTEKAAIINRGRESLKNLTDEEQLVFEYLHIRMLNTLEAWHMQLKKTSPSGEYRDQQSENLVGVIVYLFNYEGSLEIWRKVRHTFVPIQEVFENAISSAQSK